FSSRRRHTRFDCDWSSDVCSSDLTAVGPDVDASDGAEMANDEGVRLYESLWSFRYSLVALSFGNLYQFWEQQTRDFLFDEMSNRSEERRVGKECRSWRGREYLIDK